MKLVLPAAAVLLACALTTSYVATHRPVRVVDKPITVEKTVYVLSPDGKTGTPASDATNPSKTGVKIVSDWSEAGGDHEFPNGFKVVEVDGQRCIVWIRSTSDPAFNGNDTGSGMSCRPMEAK